MRPRASMLAWLGGAVVALAVLRWYGSGAAQLALATLASFCGG